MILVTGAGGKTGTAVIKALVARAARVRAFVRNSEHELALRTIGVDDVVVGDMQDASTLTKAVAGTTAVYHICPNVNPHEVAFANALIHAATRQGRPRLVYHSVLHPQIEAMTHHWNKLRVEELLFASQLDVTILQPTAYMQNCLAEWDRMLGEGAYRVPYLIQTRLSLVDLDDVAEAAALVLTSDGHAGAIYELAGTMPLSQTEIASTFSAVLKRDVRAEEETTEAWNIRASGNGVGEHERMTLIKMFQSYARDGLKGNPNVLGWLLGRSPTSFEAFAARIATQAYVGQPIG